MLARRPLALIQLLSAAFVINGRLCASASTADGNAKPKYNLGAQQNTFELGTAKLMLAWDRWHNKVGKALGKAVHKKAGFMTGAATIRIKIDREQNLAAEIVKSSGNPDFGPACLEAANSFNKDPMLQFPENSKRQDVSFDFEYKRGYLVVPKHQYIKNDYENLDQ